MHTDDLGSLPSDGFSEEEAHRVLARAVELDARDDDLISLAQLREVAAEAGITPGSLARAVREVRAAAAVSTKRPRDQWQRAAQGLARYRLFAAAASFVASAMLTPGDVLVQTTLWALPLYGAYELSLAAVRRRAHRDGPPDAPRPRASAPATTQELAPRNTPDSTRSLRLTLA